MTNTANGQLARSARQRQAIARATSRSLRTTTEQLALLNTRPGTSQRERERLTGVRTTRKRASRQKRAKQVVA